MIERAGFVARRPAELPEPDAGMLVADWPAIGAAAARAALPAPARPIVSWL